MSNLELGIELFGEKLSMPVALSPVGLTGMYARRGEVQAARAAEKRGVPFTMSSVSMQLRSEERRVGKECRSRWSPYH